MCLLEIHLFIHSLDLAFTEYLFFLSVLVGGGGEVGVCWILHLLSLLENDTTLPMNGTMFVRGWRGGVGGVECVVGGGVGREEEVVEMVVVE